MLDQEIVSWPSKNKHEGYASHIADTKEQTKSILSSLGISLGCELTYIYINYGANPVVCLYDLNDIEELEDCSEYAHEELGVPSNYIALTSIEGAGITLYDTDSERVYDVEYGQFKALSDGELDPIANSFFEFLHWCKKRHENHT